MNASDDERGGARAKVTQVSRRAAATELYETRLGIWPISLSNIASDFAGGDNVDPATTLHMHRGRFSVKSADSYEADWQVFGQGSPPATTVSS